MNEPVNILIYALDDSQEELELMKNTFDMEHIVNYKMFTSHEKFLNELNYKVHLTIIDYMLKDVKTGLEVLKEIKALNPFCQNIIVTGYADGKIVREFFINGAYDFINKDDRDYDKEIIAAIRRALPGIYQRLEIIKTWYPELYESIGQN